VRQRRNAEVLQGDLHQHRDVLVDLHIGGVQPFGPAVAAHAKGRQDRADHHREQPGQRRETSGFARTLKLTFCGWPMSSSRCLFTSCSTTTVA